LTKFANLFLRDTFIILPTLIRKYLKGWPLA
jgi:hypothetical protein